jgi:hypothetical protein
MDLLNTLKKTLNEAKKGEPQIEVVKLPVLNKEQRIEDMKQRFGASKFKKHDQSDFFKDQSEGFFFHYNPDANKYYESNASFQHMFFAPPKNAVYKEPPKIDDYWNHYNFKVDHNKKTVSLEKQWLDTRLRTYVIEEIAPHQRALEIAIERHPEIKDYKFPSSKMAKTVKEFISLDSETSIGEDKEVTLYYGTTGEEAREILANGAENVDGAYFSYTSAQDEAKESARKDPDGEWAILKIKANGKDLKDRMFGSIEIEAEVKPKDVELVKSNTKDFMKKKEKKQYKKYKQLWPENQNKFFITNEDEIEKMIMKTTQASRKSTPYFTNYRGIKGIYLFRATNKTPPMIMADENLVSEEDIKQFLSITFTDNAKQTLVGFDDPFYDWFNDLAKDKEAAYNFVFNGTCRDINLASDLIQKIFDTEKDLSVLEDDVISKLPAKE